MVNRIWQSILDSLFPATCCLCQWPARQALPLCTACRRELASNRCACARCALPLPRPGICGKCQQRPPSYDRVVAPWLYSEYLAYIIQQWKFHRRDDLTPLLADLWRAEAVQHGPVDIITPLPLHWRRLWGRGYNQSQLLAVLLARGAVDSRLDHRLLRRNRATAPQSGMDARSRARNLRGAFTVRRPCDNLRIAVVDDVFTTGATAEEVARALKSAGARNVEIWCLARTPPPGR